MNTNRISVKSVRTYNLMLLIMPFVLISAIIMGALISASRTAASRAAALALQQKNICIENLKQIRRAKEVWMIQPPPGFNRKSSDVEFSLDGAHRSGSSIPADSDLFGPNKLIDVKPVCPAGGWYSLGALAENPTCSVPGHTLYKQ